MRRANVFTKLHLFFSPTITQSYKKMFASPLSIDVKNCEVGTRLAAGSIYFVRSGFCSNFLRVPTGTTHQSHPSRAKNVKFV
jgi:hypothetical protein